MCCGASPSRARRGRPTRGILAVGALAWLLFGPPAAPAVADEWLVAEEPRVRRVEIVGNEAYGDGELRSLLRTRGSSFWPWSRKRPLRSDFIRYDRTLLEDHYRRFGYLDARVDSVVVTPVDGDAERVDVMFHLTEGTRVAVSSVDIAGAGPISEAQIRRATPLKPGGALTVPDLDSGRAAIENLYAERGHMAVSVRDSIEVSGDSARVRYAIAPGPPVRLDSVIVRGTHSTKPGFVRREIALRPGGLMIRSKLVESQQRIYDTGFYSDVQFERGAVDSTTGRADLSVAVRERNHGWWDVGVGYGSASGKPGQLRFTSEVGQRNLFREGVSGVISGRVGFEVKQDPWRARLGDRRADVSLHKRWLFGIRADGTVGLFAEDMPTFVAETDFPLQMIGGAATVRRELTRSTRVLLSYELRRVVSDSVRTVTGLCPGDSSYTSQRIRLTTVRDTRRDLLNPREGSELLASIDWVGGAQQGNASFRKLIGSAITYVPLGSRATLAMRLRTGAIHPSGTGICEGLEETPSRIDLVPVDERFFTGGGTSVRGYRENELGVRRSLVDGRPVRTLRGGTYMILGNVEVQVPLVWVIGVTAFLDAGNVWERRQEISWGRLFSLANGAGPNDMRYGAGVGLRLRTPVGTARAEYGWKLRIAAPETPDALPSRGEFHFSLGPAF